MLVVKTLKIPVCIFLNIQPRKKKHALLTKNNFKYFSYNISQIFKNSTTNTALYHKIFSSSKCLKLVTKRAYLSYSTETI